MFAAILASLLLAAGGYALIVARLQQATDRVLAQAMIHALMDRGQPVSPELMAAISGEEQIPQIQATPDAATPIPVTDDDLSPIAAAADQIQGDDRHRIAAATADAARESELASITLIALDDAGTVLTNSAAIDSALLPDRAAIAAAHTVGYDWRTRTLAGRVHMRVLTYHIGGGATSLTLQAARVLSDQDRILAELLIVFGSIGALSAALSAGGSWWLIGRAIRPA